VYCRFFFLYYFLSSPFTVIGTIDWALFCRFAVYHQGLRIGIDILFFLHSHSVIPRVGLELDVSSLLTMAMASGCNRGAKYGVVCEGLHFTVID
jgi:hypothetical protein